MISTRTPPASDDRPVGRRRIVGIDLARALAMAGMVIVHFVWSDGSGTAWDRFAVSMEGRAMPLFVLLGGIGVTLLTSRRAEPDRMLAIRAGILFLLGLLLQELTFWVAVILASYSVFFLAAIALRRLGDSALLVVAAVIAVAGSFTYQRWETVPPNDTTYDLLLDPVGLVRSLIVDGYYPFFPVASFFVLGLWLGRRDLRSTATAATLAVAGTVVGFGSLIVAHLARSWLDLAPTTFDETPTPELVWGRLLDTTGHSEMLAWVVTAAGTSVAVLGLSLLVGARIGHLLGPLVALGQLALTFYAVQAVVTQVVPLPETTDFPQELATAAAIYLGFIPLAWGWRQIFGSGPLEALLRIGSGPARPEPVDQGR